MMAILEQLQQAGLLKFNNIQFACWQFLNKDNNYQQPLHFLSYIKQVSDLGCRCYVDGTCIDPLITVIAEPINFILPLGCSSVSMYPPRADA